MSQSTDRYWFYTLIAQVVTTQQNAGVIGVDVSNPPKLSAKRTITLTIHLTGTISNGILLAVSNRTL